MIGVFIAVFVLSTIVGIIGAIDKARTEKKLQELILKSLKDKK